MRRQLDNRLVFVVLLSVVIGGGYLSFVKSPSDTEALDDEPDIPRAPLMVDCSKRVPVALNRGPEVMDGFQGDSHPILNREARIAVTATWHSDNTGMILHPLTPREVTDLFRSFAPAIPTKSYSGRDFAPFLPAQEFGAVGQMWSIDPERLAGFLKQFHPSPFMRLVAKGRRAGPDGAFAILRAVSPSHLDIAIRVHAEFDVMPDYMKRTTPMPEAWYSPACFLGRLVLNRESGTVEYFRLGLPTDNFHNVHITHATGHYSCEAHDFLRVERMELTGGDLRTVDEVRWDNQLATSEAYDRLAKVFFKFKEINWVAFDKAQTVALAQKKPIFAVVSWGALDDQSC